MWLTSVAVYKASQCCIESRVDCMSFGTKGGASRVQAAFDARLVAAHAIRTQVDRHEPGFGIDAPSVLRCWRI